MISVWEHLEDTDQIKILYECIGHLNAVDALASNPEIIVSASKDTQIMIWNAKPTEFNTTFQSTQPTQSTIGKKRKTEHLIDRISPSATIEHHSGAVSCIALDKTLFSGKDETLKNTYQTSSY